MEDGRVTDEKAVELGPASPSQVALCVMETASPCRMSFIPSGDRGDSVRVPDLKLKDLRGTYEEPGENEDVLSVRVASRTIDTTLVMGESHIS